MVYSKIRGIRNNNPGNIRRTSDAWQGLRDVQTDDAFFQFTTAEWGLRALMKLIRNYYVRYNLNTVREIISRWAPSSENNTAAYVDHVAARIGFGPDEYIPAIDAVLIPIAKAITRHENGIDPYSHDTYETARGLI